jgi:hypothetical protein
MTTEGVVVGSWVGKNVVDKYVENVGMHNYNLGCIDIGSEAGGQELEI